MSKPQMHCHFCQKPISNDEPLASIVSLVLPNDQRVYAHVRHSGVMEEYKRQGSPDAPPEGEVSEEATENHST